jgi:serine/threonine-protein kinase
VYRAYDIVLGRTVAIKFLQRQRARDANQLERFRREARTMAKLTHPQIVTVIDAGEADLGDAWAGRAEPGSTPYIIFEHVEGETLKQRIRREGPLHIQHAMTHAIQIARGLQAAHEQDIVHRDVKPQNVLLTADGDAKITDFGIARTLNEQGLTMTGRLLGSTDYVAPEQALGQQATAQSDVYSLGVVLYEMLTGRVPFTAPTPVAVAMRHVHERLPDVQARRPGLSAASASLVERATAKDLERRTQARTRWCASWMRSWRARRVGGAFAAARVGSELDGAARAASMSASAARVSQPAGDAHRARARRWRWRSTAIRQRRSTSSEYAIPACSTSLA